MRSVFFVLLGILLSSFLGACSIPIKGENENVHHLIIGFGVVTTPAEETHADILAIKTQTLGIQISDQPGAKFTAGYATSSVVAIPETTENARIDVSQSLFGPIIIKVNTQ